MNGYEKRAAIIKEKILRTTLGMLNESDLKKLRIADIAKAAQVSQVTIYNYFGSKEALIGEAFKYFIEEAIREFEAVLQTRSLKALIEYILTKEKKTYTELSPALVKTLMIDNPDISRYVQERYDASLIPLMVRMVEEGKARGEISDKISVAAVLLMMQVYMNGSALMLGTLEQREDKEAFLEELLHLFFYGMYGQKPELLQE